MNPELIKRSLLLIILSALWLPMLQKMFIGIKEEPLHGAFEKYENQDWAVDSWKAGTYQEKQEQYLNQNFGFHNSLVRLYNQIRYSVFKATNAQFMIIGKDDYLYGENYIRAYLGQNYLGKDSIQSMALKLSLIRDTLLKKNTQLVVVLCPGKASFIPDYLPDDLLRQKTGNSNEPDMMNEFRAKEIPVIDFNKWFRENHDKFKYPFYPKCGWHWSLYSQYFVGDSLVRYIEKLHGVDMPDYVLDSVTVSDENLSTDYDAGNLLNLIWKLPTYPMAYPHTHFVEEGKTKIKSLVIGDSYYTDMWSAGISKIAFDDADFWYYNKDVYSNHNAVPITTDKLDLKKEIEDKKTIILLCTDGNYHQLGFGFINDAYNLYYKSESNTMTLDKDKVKVYIQLIKDTPKWLKDVEKKAGINKIPLDSAIRLDAEYMVMQEMSAK
jgi:hypothetical protein